MLQGASSGCFIQYTVANTFTASGMFRCKLLWSNSLRTVQDKLDGDGLCCDVEVDHCGVCGGSSTTCGTVVELYAILNMTGKSDEYNVIDNVKFTVEDLIAKYLHYPNVLVSVKDIDEVEMPNETQGDSIETQAEAPIGSVQAQALSQAPGVYGAAGVYGTTAAGYGDIEGAGIAAVADNEVVGGPDGPAPLALMTVCSPHSMRKLICSSAAGRVHGCTSSRLPGAGI